MHEAERMGSGHQRLRLTVLGPVRLWCDGCEIGLRAQQRALLTLLAVKIDQPAMLAEIVDVLWGTAPPASALNTVHRYVGVLRRVMEPGLGPRREGSRVLRRGGGYLLRATADELDLLRFRELVQQAAAAADGAPHAALERLVTALRLWWGRCAANTGYRLPGRSVFDAVDAEMVAAVCTAAHLALAVGRPEEVVSLVRRAAGWEPLDEPLHARLLLVLAAAGRQAQALATFAAIRRRLADELGVDPGAELRAAHERVLRQELDPGWPARQPGGLTG